ncbi:MCP four helix bundle domain-containing protein [Flavitalea sp.]|nr:MCP four helix bundle domain-containing protein [Flavitalea sp.]
MFNRNSKGDRRKPVFFFFALLCSVILLEYSTQSHYDDLDQQMSSLYRDRLMPANYIMRLNDQLHKKQRWQMENAGGRRPEQELKQCNDSVSTLITLYQQTYLTQPEKKLWSAFKKDLQIYNEAEASLVSAPAPVLLQKKMNTSFDEAISTLSSLSELQAQEGYKLQSQSKSILNGNFLQHMLELSLLFLIGILAIHWLRTERPVLTVGTTGHSAN